MAYSNSSFFAGIGVAFAAIAVGFAGGAMVTTNAVQPPNRLERLNSGTTVGSNSAPTHQQATSANAEQSSPAQPQPQAQAVLAPATAAASSAPASDAQPVQQTQAAPAAAKADVKTDVAATNTPQSAPAPAADNPAPTAARNEHASTRPADTTRSASRKRTDDRKSYDDRRFSERKRWQDQDDRRLDEATNVVRQMPRGNAMDEVVDQDDAPRFGRPRHLRPFDEDDSPRVINEPPPRFGLFGFGN
jgi:hypothetical protein